jgi:hypothetical protein
MFLNSITAKVVPIKAVMYWTVIDERNTMVVQLIYSSHCKKQKGSFL